MSGIATLLTVAAALGQESVRRPYHDPRDAPRTYNGPGREEPEPSGLSEVRIGYFGPPDGSHPDGGSIWQGVLLALEEANAAGGYRSLPFRMVPAWAGNPWTGGVTQLVKIVYTEKIWAVLGGIDSAGTHLAEQVTTKALLPLVNPASGDRSIHTAYVPWIFSCLPGDHVQAPVLSEAVKRLGRPFAILSATDHDSRAFVTSLNSALKHSGLSPAFHVEFEAAAPNLDYLGGHMAGLGAGSLLIVSGPRDSARVLKAVRAAGFAGPIGGGPALARASAMAEAGPSAEGVFFPLLVDETAATVRFHAAFQTRFGVEGDWAALQGYDAANLLFAAIRRGGLNRARIRDALQEMSPWSGAGGLIHWDELGQNDRAVRLGTMRHGRVVP